MNAINSQFSNVTGFFSQKEDNSALEIKKQLIESLGENINSFRYDQYASYYYADSYSHKNYYIDKVKKIINAKTGDWSFFYEITDNGSCLIGVLLSSWDEEHFGFKMATLQIFIVPDHPSAKSSLKKLLIKSINYLKEQDVKYISARVNGDHITALHLMEDVGFRYYDNVIWPISSAINADAETRVRLMKSEEIDDVKRVAENFQYQRGHFYCDDRFDKKSINAMYPKWIETTVKNGEPIAVLERDHKIAGLFVFKMDQELLEYTGYKYGRLRLLALDTKFRGTGAGFELFNGTLSLIKSMGADFIDSGYSTKNHISAKLHVKKSFYSVYEEVTFHLWLD